MLVLLRGQVRGIFEDLAHAVVAHPVVVEEAPPQFPVVLARAEVLRHVQEPVERVLPLVEVQYGMPSLPGDLVVLQSPDDALSQQERILPKFADELDDGRHALFPEVDVLGHLLQGGDVALPNRPPRQSMAFVGILRPRSFVRDRRDPGRSRCHGIHDMPNLAI